MRSRFERGNARVLLEPRYGASAVTLALVTVVLLALRAQIDIVNVAMAYLLCVLLVALRAGRGPAILVAISAFVLFDFFFLPPFNTVTVASTDHVIALVVFLIVALVISGLVSDARERARAAEQEEARATLLFHLNEGLVADRSLDDILTTIVQHVVQVYGAAHAAILTREDGDKLIVLASFPAGSNTVLSRDETAVALQSFSGGQVTGLATGRAKIMAPHGIGRPAIERASREDVLYLPIDTPKSPDRRAGGARTPGRWPLR